MRTIYWINPILKLSQVQFYTEKREGRMISHFLDDSISGNMGAAYNGGTFLH